tara:strand:- start:41 stop:439 length:399 start_codon:yes stop_codon:yes gene_type:complete
MINASFNWASFIGILLVLLWIPAVTSGIFRIWFVLTRRADTSLKVLIKTFLIIFQTVGRAFFIPLAGVIFFFQGWRLDPILQFACALLAGGIAVEMVPSFIDDYQGWRKRTGRATAAIVVDSQPDDSAEENK